LIAKVIDLLQKVADLNKKLAQIVDHDRICGGWVAEFSDHVAIIVKMNAGYMATVYCRAKLAEQLFILPEGDILEINGCAGSKPAHVLFDPEKQTLMLGRYGLFCREHEVPQAELDIIDFMPEPPAGVNGEGVTFEKLSAACPERKRKIRTSKTTN
jgi:hypothetical protein